ncbi:MAG: metallophosphoesterase [Spirochaetota bacterium]
MKSYNFLIFISVALTIYGSINFYIFMRGWQAIPRDNIFRTLYVIVFLFLSLSYVAGRIVERSSMPDCSGVFIWSGSFWLGLMIYLFFSILLIDLARAFNHFIGFFPAAVTDNYEKSKLICAGIVTGVSIIIVIAGYVNACIPKLNKIEITIQKSVPDLKSLRIALATDIHLGTIISNSRLERLVDTINSLKPDLILLAGDIVDEDLAPVIKNNLGETLRKFESKYGVFAVTGNHEYIGGSGKAVKYLSEHNITMLRDRAVKIGDDFYIAGRDDRSSAQFNGHKRESLDKILEGIDRSLPVILMDHQPFALNEAIDAGVDLQLSGHTHHGQLWPFNYITSLIFELSMGYKLKGKTHFYVSSGFGTWGPPVRTTSRPEIADITVRFKK